MAGQSDRDRAYLMALAAWKTFRHSSEDPEAFAARIADVGAAKGLSAAAEAVAEDCRQHGLQMSSQRVLKGLAHHAQQQRAALATPGGAETLRVADLERRPPGLEKLLVEPKHSSGSPVPAVIVIVVVLAGVAWFFFA